MDKPGPVAHSHVLNCLSSVIIQFSDCKPNLTKGDLEPVNLVPTSYSCEMLCRSRTIDFLHVLSVKQSLSAHVSSKIPLEVL